MTASLTVRQKAILQYITWMIQTKGYPPTLCQIGEKFVISSTNGVRAHLRALEKKGHIKRRPRTSRGIKLLNPAIDQSISSKRGVEIPLVGKVAAGNPILAVENLEGTLVLDADLVRGRECFALRVCGDSMVDDGIFEGDYVLVRPQSTADNGDIVVALLRDEVTVKRFYREKDRIRLQPANPQMGSIFTTEIQIIGRVIALIRPNL